MYYFSESSGGLGKEVPWQFAQNLRVPCVVIRPLEKLLTEAVTVYELANIRRALFPSLFKAPEMRPDQQTTAVKREALEEDPGIIRERACKFHPAGSDRITIFCASTDPPAYYELHRLLKQPFTRETAFEAIKFIKRNLQLIPLLIRKAKGHKGYTASLFDIVLKHFSDQEKLEVLCKLKGDPPMRQRTMRSEEVEQELRQRLNDVLAQPDP